MTTTTLLVIAATGLSFLCALFVDLANIAQRPDWRRVRAPFSPPTESPSVRARQLVRETAAVLRQELSELRHAPSEAVGSVATAAITTQIVVVALLRNTTAAMCELARWGIFHYGAFQRLRRRSPVADQAWSVTRSLGLMATAFTDLQLVVITADRGSGGSQLEAVFAAMGGSIPLPLLKDAGSVFGGLQPAALLIGNVVILLRYRRLVGSLLLAVALTLVAAVAVAGGAVFVSGIVPEAADAFGLTGFAASSTRALAGIGAYAFAILALGQLQRLGRWLDSLP